MAKNSMKIGFKVSNFKEFADMLADLPASVASRVMGDAMGQALRPMVSAVKARVPTRTGALKKSITSKVIRYPDKGKVVGIVGPDKAARYLGGRKIVRGGKVLQTDRPANYAHLVEFGHYSAAATGKKVKSTKGLTIRKHTLYPQSFIRAQPFMRPGVAASEGAVADALADGVAVGLEREHKRQLSKLKRLRKSSA